MKKEDIYVKLTKNNIDKVISILKDAGCEYDFLLSRERLNSDVFKKLYLSYHYCYKWAISIKEPIKTLIKPKQLKELLENESTCTYKYFGNLIWEDTLLREVPKGIIGDKGEKYIPENKTLEVGKWYKYQVFDHKGNYIKIMFLFNGIKGNEGKTIGFDNNGEYCDNMSIYYASVEIFQEVHHQEVIEAFIYHMENFAYKRKNIKTAELRDILNQFHREEISFSKVVELVNKGGK